ncbi:MAG: diacylglycerol kinase family lipid kinase [Chloroflexi bacterium]|nr:diacylglycerol kinase family lipid kinase [Chloroflexota bacterium]
MGKHKIIVNPTSGRGNGARIIPQLERCLQTHGLDFDLARTERPLHASQLAQQAAEEGYDVVVAIGGDGTANEVLNGLMQAKQGGSGGQTAMAVLVAGRGNDFAYGMGMPDDLEAGCRIIADGRRKRIDVGQVSGGLFPEGRYFGNSVGIGFDAVVGFEAAKMTRLTGFVSYLVAALKTIFLYYKAPQVEIAYNGQVTTMSALMVSIMNGSRQGGVFFMSPQAQNDDGLFDMCIAEEVSRGRIFTLIPHFFKGSQFGEKEIVFGQTDRLTVTAVSGVLPAHADGETLCVDGVKLTIELLPQILDVISPVKIAGIGG